jgi:cryptochrome
MFNFNERRQACLDGMKHAYDIGMYGDDKRRLNGEWKKVFGKDGSNGAAAKNKKRARDVNEDDEEHESDDGDEADHGDVTDDERPKKAAKSSAKGGRKPQQAKLDGMVSRSKKK